MYKDYQRGVYNTMKAMGFIIGRVPYKPGVYLILEIDDTNKKLKVLYIGSSKNMRKRLYRSKHSMDYYLEHFIDEYDFGILRPVAYVITDDYVQLEKQLIKSIRPEFNIRHNG